MRERTAGSSAARPSRLDALGIRALIGAVFIALYAGGTAWGLEVEVGDAAPWFPPAGLGLAFVILFGGRFAPAIAIAELVAWATVGDGDGAAEALATAVTTAVIYGAVGAFLRRILRAEPPLTRLADLVLFTLVGIIAMPLVSALCVVAIDLAAAGDTWSVYLREVRIFAIGDAVAIVALTPAILTTGALIRGVSMRATNPDPNPPGAEDAAMALAVVATTPILVAATDVRLQFLSILPVVWVALRRGMPTGSIAVALWTMSSVLAFEAESDELTLVDIQGLLLAGAVLALAAGAIVSERERGRARLAYLALHDDVTATASQRRITLALTDALARHGEHAVAVLVVRLRGLHAPLGGLDRAVLDELLLTVAERLRGVTGPGATLARMSSSRFVVMLEGPEAADPQGTADEVLAALTPAVKLGTREIPLDPTIGVAASRYAAGPEALIAQADFATERASRSGDARRVLFDEALEREVRERQGLERRLREDIEAGALGLAFQPIVGVAADAREGVDVETLARWSPDGEPVPPDVFIPLAEERGLILALGRWVLRAACEEACSWPDVYGRAPRISVNVSPIQLQDVRFLSDVRAALRESGLPPSRLRIEVTESILVDDIDTAIARLVELRDLGVEAMLDDFGTGYSSLSWVQRLPVSALKIDRSFVTGLGKDPTDRIIVSATVGLARALDLSVVAEGVETQEQLDILRSLECSRVQGFLVSPPLPPDEFRAWLATRRDQPAA